MPSAWRSDRTELKQYEAPFGQKLPGVSFIKGRTTYFHRKHSVLTICTQTGTCDTRSGDLVFFSAAFDEFSVFTKN